MIEVAAIVCLLNTPSHCKNISLPFDAEIESITPNMCLMNGQIELSKWANEHPNWTITKWACRKPGQSADL